MKKFLFFLISTVALACVTAQAQTGIGTMTPDTSAELDITSTTRGFLPPRMTTVQRNAIALPAQGLMIYDTDSSAYMYYSSGQWKKISSDDFWLKSGQFLKPAGDGRVILGDADTIYGDAKMRIANAAPHGMGLDVYCWDTTGFNQAIIAGVSKRGAAITGHSGNYPGPATNQSIGVLGTSSAGTGIAGYTADGVGVEAKVHSGGSGKAIVSIGSLQFTGIGEAAGKVLTSDSNGNASWQTPNGSGWGLSGNAGTDSTNFIGTTDNQPLRFKVNNQKAGRIENDINIGNTALGYQALDANTTGKFNTATGYEALKDNTTGQGNTAAGYSALYANTTGNINTATGKEALFANTTGTGNTATGANTLTFNNTGASNTATGADALYVNTSGNANTATGREALYYNSAGNNNAAYGNSALKNNSTGNNNIANGVASMYSNTTGNSNVALGYQALLTNTSGNNNVAVGRDANVGDTALTNATAIGNRALVGASNSMVLGSIAGVNNATDNTKVGIGTTTPQQALHVNGQVRIDTLASGSAADSIITVDANGVLRKRDAAALAGGSLDAAYDFGGAGAGRTITADSGAVKIAGTDGLLVTGAWGSGAPVEVSGAGTRMFFNPNKAAFRAGFVSGTKWDDTAIGNGSAAIGIDAKASGYYATAIGHDNTASGSASVVIGDNNLASGNASIAMGYYTRAYNHGAIAIGISNTASGNSSTAMGGNANIASGDYAMAMGYSTSARSYGETVVGTYNTPYNPASATSWNAADRLFTIGNGTFDFINGLISSDAMVVLKNGKTGIGTSTPSAKLDVLETGSSQTAIKGVAPLGFAIFGQSDSGIAGYFTATNGTALATGLGRVGIGNMTPQEQLDVSGAIKIADAANPATSPDGTIRYTAGNGFQARHNNTWQPLAGGSPQTLSINGNQLSISDGNTVTVPGGGLTLPYSGTASNGSGAVFSLTSTGSTAAVEGNNSSSTAVNATTASGTALRGVASGSGSGVFAQSGTGTAGVFISSSGTAVSALSAGTAGSFTSTSGTALQADGVIKLKTTGAASGKFLMATDANGTAEWVNAPGGGGGGTLDAAYDNGGSGAGRTITADAGAVLVSGTDGLQVTGTMYSGVNLALSGAGTKMFFYPKKAALRAGNVDGNQWDHSNVGEFSVAIGRNATASGSTSVALGGDVNAASECVAIGNFATATANSVSIGSGTASSGSSATALGFYTTASGSYSTAMGYNTTAPSFAETVIGRFNTTYSPLGSNNNWNTSDRLFVIGNGTTQYARSDAFIVYKDGNATLSGTLTQSSDKRLKRNITPLQNSLEKLLKLNGYNYQWIKDLNKGDALQIGFIAQEVEALFPELVVTDANGMKSVAYQNLVPVLVEAIKELKKENETLKDANETLNARTASIEDKMQSLETLLLQSVSSFSKTATK